MDPSSFEKMVDRLIYHASEYREARSDWAKYEATLSRLKWAIINEWRRAADSADDTKDTAPTGR